MLADGPPVFVNTVFLIVIFGKLSVAQRRGPLRRSKEGPSSGAWSRDPLGRSNGLTESSAETRTFRTPQRTSTSPPRSPLPLHPVVSDWLGCRKCALPLAGSPSGLGARDTYLSWSARKRYWDRRQRSRKLWGEKRLARRRSRYVGAGREPRASDGWPGRRFLALRAPL